MLTASAEARGEAGGVHDDVVLQIGWPLLGGIPRLRVDLQAEDGEAAAEGNLAAEGVQELLCSREAVHPQNGDTNADEEARHLVVA